MADLTASIASANRGLPRLFGVIPAAGEGTRFGTQVPKQYLLLGGRPVLAHALDRLQAAFPLETLVVALARDDAHYDRAIGHRTGVEPVLCGGRTRGETVRNALATLDDRCSDDDWVIVHDAARPCVPRESLQRLLAAVRDDAVGGLLAIPLGDTLKRADRAGDVEARVATTPDRSQLWRAQTPQMFRFGLLREALGGERSADATDEAQAVERLGHRPLLVMGSTANLKITYPDDLVLATAILASQDVPSPLPPLPEGETEGTAPLSRDRAAMQSGKGRGGGP